MFVLIRTVAIVVLCSVAAYAQSTEAAELIKEINADNAKARSITYEAERKRGEARTRGEAGDHSEHARLITEASKLYGKISSY